MDLDWRYRTRGWLPKVRLSKPVADTSKMMRLSKTTPRRPSSMSPRLPEPRPPRQRTNSDSEIVGILTTYQLISTQRSHFKLPPDNLKSLEVAPAALAPKNQQTRRVRAAVTYLFSFKCRSGFQPTALLSLPVTCMRNYVAENAFLRWIFSVTLTVTCDLDLRTLSKPLDNVGGQREDESSHLRPWRRLT